MRATRHYKEALLVANTMDNKPMMAACLVAMGALVAKQGRVTWATQLWGDDLDPFSWSERTWKLTSLVAHR
jgi:hypothetical protein